MSAKEISNKLQAINHLEYVLALKEIIINLLVLKILCLLMMLVLVYP